MNHLQTMTTVFDKHGGGKNPESLNLTVRFFFLFTLEHNASVALRLSKQTKGPKGLAAVAPTRTTRVLSVRCDGSTRPDLINRFRRQNGEQIPGRFVSLNHNAMTDVASTTACACSHFQKVRMGPPGQSSQPNLAGFLALLSKTTNNTTPTSNNKVIKTL